MLELMKEIQSHCTNGTKTLTRQRRPSMRSFSIGLLLIALNLPSPAFVDAQSALDSFKSLQGKWAIQSEGKSLTIRMTYASGSKGSIVTEQFGQELSVFYQDGPSLLMTHYCNGGNQPRLKLSAQSQPGLLEFDMFDITNLKSPDAAHVQRIIYRIVDANRFDLEIVWQQGKEQESEKYTLSKL